MISGARESERERGVRDGVVCVVVSSKRALKGKETVCAPKSGLFLSVSDLFLGKHTTKEVTHGEKKPSLGSANSFFTL